MCKCSHLINSNIGEPSRFFLIPFSTGFKGVDLISAATAQAATQAALHQALSEGLVHSDASNAAAAFGVSCDYHWTADPSVVLEPVGSGVCAL